MAEAAAAFYAAETVVEGAAVGAYHVSQSTTPLHLRFRKIGHSQSSATSRATRISHSLDIVAGKAYVFGGDGENRVNDSSLEVITLPSDIENGEVDYQLIEPEIEKSRPLESYASGNAPQPDAQGFENATLSGSSEQTIQTNTIPPRAAHASTSIGPRVYILAGRRPRSSLPSSEKSLMQDAQLFNCDQIHSYSTQTNRWTIIQANTPNCKDGLPPPRINASCTSTPHPQPDSAVEVSVHAHGTIFLHGGYDVQGNRLRDTWAFDVSSQVWSRWPDLPEPLAEEIAGEGRVACIDDRLWCVGDGFGKMLHIDFDLVHGDVVGATSGPHHRETGISPQGSGWEIFTFGEKAANTGLLSQIGAASKEPITNKAENLPVPRQGAGFLPVKVGAGRMFLLYFMGSDGPGSTLGDVWSFQVKAEEKTLASMKDAIRNAVGKATGENHWAPCEIIESTKGEGQVFPPRGLGGFASDVWSDHGGGTALLLGGVDEGGLTQSQCWVMSVQ